MSLSSEQWQSQIEKENLSGSDMEECYAYERMLIDADNKRKEAREKIEEINETD